MRAVDAALLPISRKEVLRYLRHRGGPLTEEMEALLKSCEEELRAVARPRYCHRFFALERQEAALVLAGSSALLPGRQIAELLEGCDGCALLGATLGGEVDRLIRRAQVEQMARAVVLDALGTAAVEALCDLAGEEIRRAAAAEGKSCTWRFSPGYGDLPLDCQRDFLGLLDAPRQIGLTLTPQLMMVPEKSVSAIIGVGAPSGRGAQRGCEGCALQKNCVYRREGLRCAEPLG